jgi:glycosyltransferase involved in cell wall biosynthesis
MASGLPVVATHVGGADELVVDGSTGMLVQPRDSGTLADALDRLVCGGPLRQALGRAGRARAHAEFSLERMIQNYQSVYCDIADRRVARA